MLVIFYMRRWLLDARFGTSISKPRPPVALFCGGPLDSYTGYGQSGPMYRHSCRCHVDRRYRQPRKSVPLVLNLVRVISPWCLLTVFALVLRTTGKFTCAAVPLDISCA